uniref:Cytochrome P450 n=1 Tax=Populus davidiana TaxID=266767 RepID=A0A6M2F5W5_9ROSI
MISSVYPEFVKMLEVHSIILHPYSLACLLFIFVTKWFFFNSARNKNSPPSPLKIPVVGNLLQLGSYPHRSLQSLAKRHGQLMLLHLGNAPTLVVSSADGARENLRAHDVIFSNRPDSSIARRLLYDYKDLSLAPYGEYWRQMRSICVVQLLSSKRVKLFQSIREEETALLVQNVELFSSRSLQVDLSELFSELTNDVVCRVSFGKKYREGDSGRKFKKLLEEFGAVLGVFNVRDFIPWLGWINHLTGLNARVEWVFKEFDRFLDEVIEESKANRVGVNCKQVSNSETNTN